MSKTLQALFTDLDGSLLNDKRTIGQEDIQTLSKLQEKGVKVFLATGRHFSMARYYANQLNIKFPVISCNGAIIYDFSLETSVKFSIIPQADVETLIDFAKENNIVFYTYTNKTMYLSQKESNTEVTQSHIDNSLDIKPNEFVFTDENFVYPTDNVVKFMFSDCNKEMYSKFLNTDLGKSDKLEIAFSGHDFVDINIKGDSKGAGIQYLANKYNFSLKNTLVMGDNFNDIPMLSLGGYPVVPQSACDEIKKFASFVTSSNNDNPITFAIKKLFPELLN